MFINKSRISIIIRVLLLVVSIFLFIYFFQNPIYHFVYIFFIIAIIFQTYNLICFMDRTNRDLKKFIESIKYAELNCTFPIKYNDDKYNNLKKTFNEIISDFKNLRAEKSEDYFFFNNIIQHIAVSLIAFDNSTGEVKLINNSAKRLFKLSSLKNIKELNTINKEFEQLLFNLKSGEKNTLKIYNDDEILQLIIFAKELKIKNTSINLISFQDIKGELEEEEMEAWQKLIRVLTHEIMNSISPIISLSSTVSDLFLNNDIKELYKGSMSEYK